MHALVDRASLRPLSPSTAPASPGHRRWSRPARSSSVRPAGLHPRIVEPVDDATRRQFIGIIGAAGLALSGCADDPASGHESAGETRTFVDALGHEVEVPARPKRIVALHQLVTAQLLSLDAPVIGSTGLDERYLDGFDLSGIADVGAWDEPDIEAIIGLEPDLVVLNVWDRKVNHPAEVVEQLEKVAPVVALEHGAGPDDDLPSDRVAPYADLVGTDPEVIAAQEAAYQALVREIRGLLGPDPAAITVANLEIYNGNSVYPQIIRQGGALTHVLRQAGVSWAYDIETSFDDPKWETSVERLRDLPADLVVIARTERAQLENPVVQSLPAVEAGQAILSTRDFGNLASYPAYIAGATFIRDELTKMPRPLRSDIVDWPNRLHGGS
jgi:ABC-type Fe3+-hydroxamate transport system substrate-binding protein